MQIRLSMFYRTLIIFSLGIFLAGCSQSSSDPNAAIQKAIEDHLANRSDLSIGNMVMEMKDVRIDGDHAQADVLFRTTSNPPAQMAYTYLLLQTDGKWEIETAQPSGADSSHPTPENPGVESETLPEGQPPAQSPH